MKEGVVIMGKTTVRFANKQDIDKIIAYLKRANLGTEGVDQAIDYFLVMENEFGELAGTLGVEPVGDIGLLRSLAVSAALDETDILLLFNKMLFHAKDKNLAKLYLATNNSGSQAFFELIGFKRIEKGHLPQQLLEISHVKTIFTVDNSLFMELSL